MNQKRVQDFVDELKCTPEFHALKQARNKLEKDSELKARVERFLTDNSRILGQPGSGSDPRYSEISKRYTELIRIPEVVAYFEAGQNFEEMVARLYQSISGLITNALESDK